MQTVEELVEPVGCRIKFEIYSDGYTIFTNKKLSEKN